MIGEYDAGYENCIDSMVRQMEDMQFRIDNLHRENVKLRELVRDMWLHSYCSIAKTREDDERHIEDIIDRMRELGIEVS